MVELYKVLAELTNRFDNLSYLYDTMTTTWLVTARSLAKKECYDTDGFGGVRSKDYQPDDAESTAMMSGRVDHMLKFLKEKGFEQYDGTERVQHYIDKEMY